MSTQGSRAKASALARARARKRLKKTGPVMGDKTITIPVPVDGDKTEGSTDMATDLPPAVAEHMMVESTGNIQASNRNSRMVGDAVMGALAGTVQTNFAEVGVLESRAVSGIVATPIAGPTAPAPAAR